ncbi:MAG: hypothetical protein R3F17_13425 [Planctomycetota bacterium]
MERLNHVMGVTQRCIEFVNNVYIPDILAVGKFAKGWLYGADCRARA